jgi:hypothetical protein
MVVLMKEWTMVERHGCIKQYDLIVMNWENLARLLVHIPFWDLVSPEMGCSFLTAIGRASLK